MIDKCCSNCKCIRICKVYSAIVDMEREIIKCLGKIPDEDVYFTAEVEKLAAKYCKGFNDSSKHR